MLWKTRIGVTVAAVAALVLSGTASPASAAVPKAPTGVTVTRSAAGGYTISWKAVSGATGYVVYRQNPVREDQSGRGWLVIGATQTVYYTVGKNVTSLRTSDLLSPEVNLGAASQRFSVAAKNASGIGPAAGKSAGCAPAYFISARGSGQNPTSSNGNPAAYADGLGDRGKRVYEDARTRLGLSRSQFQANMVGYEAVSILNWRNATGAYKDSVETGVKNATTQVKAIASACPSARIILFGYSQGAQVVGNAFAGLATSVKSHVTQVQLFADPLRNPADLGIFHRPAAQPGQYGILGKRSAFSGLTDKQQVTTWCWTGDDICSFDGKLPVSVHGSAYDCYEDWAAEGIAARARNVKWRTSADISHPSCKLVS